MSFENSAGFAVKVASGATRSVSPSGGSPLDRLRAHAGIAAGPILHHDGLSPHLLQPLTDHARHHIGHAACRNRNDQLDGTARISLRRGRGRQHCQGDAGRCSYEAQHVASSHLNSRGISAHVQFVRGRHVMGALESGGDDRWQLEMHGRAQSTFRRRTGGQ
jgi:hypothetical protein